VSGEIFEKCSCCKGNRSEVLNKAKIRRFEAKVGVLKMRTK